MNEMIEIPFSKLIKENHSSLRFKKPSLDFDLPINIEPLDAILVKAKKDLLKELNAKYKLTGKSKFKTHISIYLKEKYINVSASTTKSDSTKTTTADVLFNFRAFQSH